MIGLDIKVDVAAAIAALDRLDDKRIPFTVAEAVANEVVMPNLAKYPGQSHAKQPFVSDRSRKYFFAALRSGQLVVPYRRTGQLSGNWQRVPYSDGLALRSGAPYSDLVRTAGKQARYHAGNWPTTEDIARQSEADAALAATAAIVKIIGDAGP